MVDHLHPEFHAEVIKELYANSNAISWSLNGLDGFFEAIRPNIWKRSASTFQNTCMAFSRRARSNAKHQD
jgi:hypothetical protein